ncbi:MAG TPA: ThuA domain-containing protein, partial [Chitinophagaceae bacterium]|nr:ThuA domain-containing protein [Chitinophagaceae bacterium]
MQKNKFRYTKALLLIICLISYVNAPAQPRTDSFRVLGFYTAKNDAAHISFVHEANRWFTEMAIRYHFRYDSTADWTKLNDTVLAQYRVVLFLDTRPEDAAQRAAFETYMKNGGAWMGFHFSAFALTP